MADENASIFTLNASTLLVVLALVLVRLLLFALKVCKASVRSEILTLNASRVLIVFNNSVVRFGNAVDIFSKTTGYCASSLNFADHRQNNQTEPTGKAGFWGLYRKKR